MRSFPIAAPIISCCLVVLLGFGCKKETRNDPLHRMPSPVGPAPVQEHAASFEHPMPPEPPPMPTPTVFPPKANLTAETVPAMPPSGVPYEIPDHPSEATSTLSKPLILASTQVPSEEEDGPVRDRIRERRDQRQQRREEQPEPIPPANTPPVQEPMPLPIAQDAKPPVEAEQPEPAKAATELETVEELLQKSLARWNQLVDFQARLVKEEVVKGKQQPRDEIAYKFRKQPLSVHMRILSDAGQGREILYVHGRDSAMHALTGKGDNLIVGAGFKTTVKIDSSQATSKSRYKVTEAGFGRVLGALQRSLAAAKQGADTVKYHGPTQRAEYPYPLEAVELQLRPGDDPLMRKGGVRMIYFDPKPDSQSYLFPVLVTVNDETGALVEYHLFDQFRSPANLTDADFDPAQMGKR